MYGKAKVLPVINGASHHEGMRKKGGTVPRILNLGTLLAGSGQPHAPATLPPVPTK
jgi:hypothetical protein